MKPLQLGALGFSVLAAGCSADVARFDFPGSGFTDRGATGSLPMPRETVYNRPTGYLGGGDRIGDAPAPVAGSSPYPYQPPRAARDEGVQVAALPPPAAPPAAPAPLHESPPVRSASRPAPARAAEPVRPASAPAAPAAEAAAVATGEPIEVKSGDTLYGLSRRHHVSLNELMQVNGLKSPALKPGQKLVLPASSHARKPLGRPVRGEVAAAQPARPVVAPPAGWNATYTVKPGDSLYAIALHHKIKLAELQKVNGIVHVRRVRPGTVLKVPGEGGPAATAAVPVAAAPSLPLASTAPQEAAPQSSGSAAVQPTTIINRPKVASLGPDKATMIDAPAAAAESRASEKVAAVAPTAAAVPPSSRLRWPAKGKISHGFGQRPDGTHNDGIDVAVPMGTEVHAAEAGEVAYVGSELKAYGNLVLVRHSNGWVTAYAHNDQVLVKRGDKVKRGQVLAKAGKTGQVDQPTVHFELRQGKDPVDPLPFLEKI